LPLQRESFASRSFSLTQACQANQSFGAVAIPGKRFLKGDPGLGIPVFFEGDQSLIGARRGVSRREAKRRREFLLGLAERVAGIVMLSV
jgi:hypothetical protein